MTYLKSTKNNRVLVLKYWASSCQVWDPTRLHFLRYHVPIHTHTHAHTRTRHHHCITSFCLRQGIKGGGDLVLKLGHKGFFMQHLPDHSRRLLMYFDTMTFGGNIDVLFSIWRSHDYYSILYTFRSAASRLYICYWIKGKCACSYMLR